MNENESLLSSSDKIRVNVDFKLETSLEPKLICETKYFRIGVPHSSYDVLSIEHGEEVIRQTLRQLRDLGFKQFHENQRDMLKNYILFSVHAERRYNRYGVDKVDLRFYDTLEKGLHVDLSLQ